MEKKPQNTSEDIKADLKHDTMEFAASTDGDDILDTDDATYEEEGITSEELDSMEEDDPESQAYALNAVETDRLADEDNLPEEDWQQDLPDGPANKEDSDEYENRK